MGTASRSAIGTVVASLGADVGPLDVIDPSSGDPDLEEYPTVRRLSGALSEKHAATGFEEAFESLLERLHLMLTQVLPPAHADRDPRRD